MGFDNECIPNIQSLAGEYFCPVCRLLVYPNEALQSQCTHLYCKACLTYVVSTTRACPYDGYLVTEADSKPLIESNKALAETIGKITVHCLYQRSGCTWQGNLSECTSHCSGCAFGNSPVVCNRCGVQIIHRQVQEHAQSCPGVQPQAQNVQSTQDATTTTTATTSEHTQAITLPATSTTQLHTSQTTTTSQPGQDPSQQANTKVQTVVSAAVPTAEQWYQQQQQYQQYYQQYAAYQQQYYQYYPYHQQAIPPYQQSQVYVQPQASQVQLQPNLQLQPQAQLQTQPQLHVPTQLPVAAQPQTQALVNPQQQTHTVSQPQSQIQPPVQLPTHGYSHPQSQPLSQNQTAQPYPQLVPPQYQQPHVQMQQAQPQIQPPAHSQFQPQHIPIPQPQPHLQGQSLMHAQHHPLPLSQPVTSQPNQPLIPNLLSQSQNPSASAVTDPHTHLQVHQQVQLGAPQHPLHMHLQVGPRPQSQLPIQPPSQYPQQPPLLRPPQSHGTSQNQQQGLLPSPGQVPVVHPAQQLPGPYAHQPGVHVHQFPAQQPMHQEYPQHQQLFAGQPLGPVQNQGNQQGPFIQQQLHGQSQLRPQGPQQPFQQNLQAYQQPQHNFSLPNTIQHHPAQSPAGWPTMPPQVVPTQPHSQSLVGIQLRPGQSGGNQQSGNILRTESHVQSSSEQLSRANLRPFSERHDHNDEKGAKAELSSHHAAKRVALDLGTDGGEMKRESEVKLEDVSNEPIGETKDSPKSLAADNGGLKKVKEEPTEGTVNQKDVSDVDKELSVTEGKEMKDVPQLKTPSLQEGEHLDRHGTKFHKEKKVVNQIYRGFRLHGQEQEGGLGQSSHSVPAVNQGWQNHPGYHGPFDLQQGPVGPPLLQAPSPGRPHHAQLPEHPSTQLRPLGPGCTGFPGQPLNPLSEHPQQPGYKHPYGPEVLNAAITAPVSTSGFGRGPSRGPLPEGPYTQGKQSLSHGEAEMFPNQRPGYIDGRRADPLGQQSSMHSNSMGMNESIVRDSSPMLDRRHRALPNERFNPFPQDLSRRNIAREEFEGDLKHLPRPSHLNADIGPVVRGNFSLPGPLDRGQHGFRMDPAGSAPSRLFPPYPYDGVLHSNDAVERPVPGYVHRHRDGLGPRSPGGDFPGLPSRRFGAFHRLDNVDGGELDRFDSISRSFHDSRFPTFPGHLRGGEYDGPGNLRRGEHLSGSQDGLHNHLQRGEHLGPHDLPRHLRLEGFVAAFPGHARMGDFSRRVHPLLGEPGFRSNYSLKRFPADGGSYAGDVESFDNSRKRKVSSMGWCRICKVDCETVEGLDLHSQTREHQKMSLDIVLTIKQNAKKQKLDSYALDVESKPKNVSSEDSGSKQ